jgi:hypothetical protein
MYLIIAYHGKGKSEVEEDLKKLWFNYSNFVKSVKVKHVYFFQNAKDDKGADLLMIIDYKCKYAKGCFDAQAKKRCGAGAAKQSFALKNKSVNYWLYVREPKHVKTA